MQILEYNNLDYSGLEAKYQRVKSALETEDYYTAQIKKLRSGYNQSLYAARLDHANRVLLKFAKYQDQKYILILEIIRNHDYDGSKFLNGAKVIEDKIPLTEEKDINASLQDADIEDLKYINVK